MGRAQESAGFAAAAMIIGQTYESALRALLPGQEVQIADVRGGGNSRIFSVQSSIGRYALKEYPREQSDPRRRQETERFALAFLYQRNMHNVPRFFGSSEHFSLYSWMHGSSIDIPSDEDIVQAVDMLELLQAYSAHPQAVEFSPAFEACISLDALTHQLEQRYEKLFADFSHERLVHDFVAGDLRVGLTRMAHRARSLYERHRLSRDTLSRDQQRLIHGDYGLHNMLKDGDGSLQLLDFEYFGWDDPVKMIADFALHPGTQLSAAQRAHFLQQSCRRFASNTALQLRMAALLPLFAVRWACIAVNGLLSGRRCTQEQQLLKASSLLTLCDREGLL